MSIPGAASPLFIGAAAAEEAAYQIDRSLRFNLSDSAFLSWNPPTAGDSDTTFTYSAWCKRTDSSTDFLLFQSKPGVQSSNQFDFRFNDENLRVFGRAGSSGQDILLETTAVYVDFSAWYHVVLAIDSSQSTSSDRAKLYVNGVRVTDFTTEVYPSQNDPMEVGNTSTKSIGRRFKNSGGSEYSNGYLADVHFIDGQALAPTDFGEYDDNNNWNPKAYSGSYGTNGFHLDFSDNTSTTTIAEDSSGNNNDWTANNISVASGAGNDSLLDSPTNYDDGTNVGGNYCTWNPLYNTSSGATLSNGNLDFTTAGSGGNSAMPGTMAVSSGKWYWEITPTAIGSGVSIGIAYASEQTTDYPGYPSTSWAYKSDGNKINNASASSYGASYTTNDIIGVALDLDAGTLVFYKNGSSQGTAFSSLSGTFVAKVGDVGSQASMVANFGQRQFSYTPPTGYKSLCTQNLPDPTIADGSTVFDVALDTGANILSSTKALCNNGADFLWIKDRANSSTNHHLIDIVRDTQLDGTPFLASNNDLKEATLGTYAAPSGNSVGFAWEAGTTTDTSNTAGSITPTGVRANASAGFSITNYVANNTAGATVGHGLNDAPRLILVKDRDSNASWAVYHYELGATKFLKLDATDAATTNSNRWNNTEPTDSVFTVGTAVSTNGNSGNNYIAYCFAPVNQYSSFGVYTGNGSSDGPMVYTGSGFRPRWVMIKRTDTSNYWIIQDAARNTFNVVDLKLAANSSEEENDLATIGDTSQNTLDFLSNGFKCRTGNAGTNASGGTYVWAAFASHPFKTARAR